MFKKIIISFLLVVVMLPAGLTQAAYAPYPGQSIDMTTSGLRPTSVNMRLADLRSVGAQTFGISIFGRDYTLDVSASRFLNAAGSPIAIQSFAAGNRINVIGSLDAVTPSIIHALIVRSLEAGTFPPGGGTQPTVNLVANPTTVDPGETSTLAWSSTNATSCSGSRVGDSPSPVSLNQTPFSTVPLYTTTSWSITCLGAPGTTPATDTVTVTVTGSTNTPPGGGIQPTVDLIANPTTVNPGATSTLAWSSTNATVCYGGKVGDLPSLVSPNQAPFSTIPLYETTSWSITCLGAANTTPMMDTVTMTVATTGGDDGGTSTSTPPGGDDNPIIPPDGTPGSTTGICATGGQYAGGIGWERPFGNAVVNVVRVALGCYSVRRFQMPSGDGPPSGASINHRFLWYVWDYGAAMHAGNNQHKISARAKLIDFLDDQRVYGHYTIPAGGTEILNTSHYQIWSNAGAAARLLAFIYNDTAMLSATGRWWRAEKALWDTLEHGGSIDSPGGRFNGGNTINVLRDANYALLTGRNLPGGASMATGPWWDNYYNVSAWMVRILLNRGDDLGGARNAGQSDIPLLPYPLCIYSRGSDYVHYFPNMPNTYEPLHWVASIGGDRSLSNPNSLPPPALPGATLTVLPGKTGSSSNCPATL